MSSAILYNQIAYDIVHTMSYTICKEPCTTSCIQERYRIPNIRYCIRHLQNLLYSMFKVKVFANRIYDITYDIEYDIVCQIYDIVYQTYNVVYDFFKIYDIVCFWYRSLPVVYSTILYTILHTISEKMPTSYTISNVPVTIIRYRMPISYEMSPL